MVMVPNNSKNDIVTPRRRTAAAKQQSADIPTACVLTQLPEVQPGEEPPSDATNRAPSLKRVQTTRNFPKHTHSGPHVERWVYRAAGIATTAVLLYLAFMSLRQPLRQAPATENRDQPGYDQTQIEPRRGTHQTGRFTEAVPAPTGSDSTRPVPQQLNLGARTTQKPQRARQVSVTAAKVASASHSSSGPVDVGSYPTTGLASPHAGTEQAAVAQADASSTGIAGRAAGYEHILNPQEPLGVDVESIKSAGVRLSQTIQPLER